MYQRVVFILAGSLLAGSSCGGTSPTMPPPAAPTPVTVTILAGDGQQADPGQAVAVRPAVIVKDAGARPVAGVAVSFAVDSGSGSVAGTSATTGADGIATSGVWTLGTSGPNVLIATVVGLPPVRFHATALGPPPRTLFEGLALPPEGGSLKYTKSGDPLSGLTLTVPVRAFPGSTHWTVTADPGVAVPLPPDFSQVGPVLEVTNGQGVADSVMTLTVPMHLANDVAVAPFYVEAGSLEPIPLVDRTDSSATLATRHFSADRLALPQNAPTGSAFRAGPAAAFGTVRIVWVSTPKQKLVGTFTSSFRPGVDDWEFVNLGDYISPDGDCEGMSVTAMYYHAMVRASGQPSLFHRYDQSLKNQWDNLQGIRFAGSVQGDYDARFAAGIRQVVTLTAQAVAKGVQLDNLTSAWILLTLKLDQHPVLMGLHGSAGGHAVVAYAATSNGTHTDVLFADPNYPGQSRTMAFEAGVLTPVQLQLNGRGTSSAFSKAYALGVSAEIPINQIATRWAEFTQRAAGGDRYPTSYRFETYDYLTNTWVPLPAALETTDPQLKIRTICTDCPTPVPGRAPGEQTADIWDADGQQRVASQTLSNAPGKTSYLAVAGALSPFSPSRFGLSGFLDTKSFAVTYAPFTVHPDGASEAIGVDISFAASPGGLGGPGPVFRWDFGDGTPAVTKTADSTITHQWSKAGSYTVTVELRTAAMTLLARTTVPVAISPFYAWSLVTATVTASSLPPGGIGPLPEDTAVSKLAAKVIADLVATPTQSAIYVVGKASPGAACAAGAYFAQFPGAIATDSIPFNALRGVLGICGGEPLYTGTLTFGPLWDGILDGIASQSVNLPPDTVVFPGGSIHATVSPGELIGTFTFKVRYSTGLGSYTISFEAIRELPPA